MVTLVNRFITISPNLLCMFVLYHFLYLFTSPITPPSDKYLASVKYFISKLKLRGNQCVGLILRGISRALLGI